MMVATGLIGPKGTWSNRLVAGCLLGLAMFLAALSFPALAADPPGTAEAGATLTPAPALTAPADPDAVVLKADNGFKFDAATESVVAEGNVRLAYRKITLSADRFRIDLKKDLLHAEGHVVYVKESDRVEADSVEYDLKNESGTFYAVNTTYQGDDVKGKVLVRGETMDSSKSLLRLAKADLTTCDLPDPHYHLEAKEITIHLDDYLEARQVAYYEGRFHLATLPYLAIPLKKENQFELPRFGYSAEDGWFLKTTYNYFHSKSSYGSYFLDWYQLRGFGAGLKHNYSLGRAPWTGDGWGYVYVKGDRTKGDNDVYLGVNHQQAFAGTWRGSLAGTFEKEAAEEPLANFSLQLSQQAGAGSFTSLNAAYRRQAEVALGSANLSFNTVQRLPGQWEWRFLTTANRYPLATSEPGEEKPYDQVSYDTTLARQFTDFTLRVRARQSFRPSLLTTTEPAPSGEPWERYSDLPELSIESRNLTLNGRPFPITLSGSVFRHEEFRKISAWNATTREWESQWTSTNLATGSLSGRLNGLSYRLTPKLSVNLNGEGRSMYYQDGEYMMGVAVRPELTYRPYQPVAMSLRYDWQDKLGSNPFSTIGMFPTRTVYGSATYTAKGLTADLSGNYNQLTSVLQNVTARVNVNRAPYSASGAVTFSGNGTTQSTRFLGTMAYLPREGHQYRLGTTYNLETDELERLDAQIAQPLGKEWRLELVASYDGIGQQFSRGEVGVVRDMHCRELRLRYDEVAGQMWLELRIKALPAQTFRFGASEQRLMFDASALGGLLSSSPTGGTGVPR